MGKRFGKLFLSLVVCLLSACASDTKDPVLFLPKVVGPEGADLEALRARYCQGVAVSLDDHFLTPENFRAIFDCANYDSSLEGLRPLFTSQEFPAFLKNMNLILGSDSVENLRESLRPWLEEGPEGSSRLDRLLPTLAKIIKHPSFQAGLPLLQRILAKGESVWKELLPNLAEFIYQERFPDNFSDIAALFPEAEQNGDYATKVKQWAAFLGQDVDGESLTRRALALGDRARELELPGTSVQEFLDHLNEKGVLVSLYLDSGAVRGEQLEPSLNADPDPDEIRDGLSFTPAERQDRAYRRLFAGGPNGEEAPITQLAGLIEEFNRPHPKFFPDLALWVSGHGAQITDLANEYVVRAQVLSELTALLPESYLTSYLALAGRKPQDKVTKEEFVAFLQGAFAAPAFGEWLNAKVTAINHEQFGPRNSELLAASGLQPAIRELYNLPAMSAFGATLFKDKPLAISAAIKRFSNLHRNAVVDFHGAQASVETQLVDSWWLAARTALGESVVLDFGLKIFQTLFTQMAADFGKRNITLSHWYYGSPYVNPGSFESLFGYGVKELDLFPRYLKHKEYLKSTLANEIFSSDDDRRAFRLLVDQIPHIWLYLKSGASRAGSDLTRAMAAKDRGYLIRQYVELISVASRKGLIGEGARLIEAYHQAFSPNLETKEVSDELEDRRKVSQGADALKRVARSLFEPETKGQYSFSTLGRILVPISALVSPLRRAETETFVLTSADQLLRASDEDINAFLREFLKKGDEGSVADRRENMRATAEFLRDPIFPDVIRQLSQFFEEDAVKPALNYLAEKIDDGSLQKILLLLRRVMGFRG